MPLQAEVIEALRGMKYITVIDGSAFFYQFLVPADHRERLTIISHRGKEMPNVALMGYKDSPAIVQRYMDRKMKDLRHCSRCFIDDVVVFSRTAPDHLRHLRDVLFLFQRMSITLSPKKSFLHSIPICRAARAPCRWARHGNYTCSSCPKRTTTWTSQSSLFLPDPQRQRPSPNLWRRSLRNRTR
jgi:hypothetical protein